MSAKTKKLIELLTTAIYTGNDDLAAATTTGVMQEFSAMITKALCPMSPVEVPFAIATLETYAEFLRQQFPEANEPADAAKKIPFTAVRIPVNGENDK